MRPPPSDGGCTWISGRIQRDCGLIFPGGAALNSTQVGSLRAAEHIADTTAVRPFQKAEFEAAARALEPWLTPLLQMSGDANAGSGGCRLLQGFQQRMSESAAHLRSLPAMAALAAEIEELLREFPSRYPLSAPGGFAQMLRVRNTLLTQAAVLSAMRLSAETFGSRGAGLVCSPNGRPLPGALSETRAVPALADGSGQVVTTVWTGTAAQSRFTPVRPIPVREDWFETVWRNDRARRAKRCF